MEMNSRRLGREAPPLYFVLDLWCTYVEGFGVFAGGVTMEEVSLLTKGDHDLINLPPGFRFHPTDEEIITYYLSEKVVDSNFGATAIGEVDLNKCEPWDLPKKAKMGEKEWYFFFQRDRKYPTGMRTNRATESGYWKATGKDKEIYKGKGKGCLVGMKKTLVFYTGRAPKGEKTNWVMHEYRLEGKFSYYNLPKTAKDEWVVCRVFHKSAGIKNSPVAGLLMRNMNSYEEDLWNNSPSLPPLSDTPDCFTTSRPGSSLMDGEDVEFKGTTTASASDGNQLSYFSSSMDHHQRQNQKSFLPPNYYSNANNYQGNPSNAPPNSMFYPQIPLPNPLFSFQAGSPNSGYLHQLERNNSIPSFPSSGFNGPDLAILRALADSHDTSGLKRQCKVEQFSSNQSMLSHSQDTGLSTTDINTEISSVVSKHDMGSSRPYEALEGPSAGPIVDLEYVWNY
ncbi:hypothetical protein HHK36_017556 [Tetracentron sinense]|uniref:NAC domain-containing protein n=1 Tax=Tetracentron sinense TaxID=13715 RepID=A0A834Z3H5_TETSI|nr:hypothetical protein HHK36_017556 [Tetracentron sinense]